MAKIRLSYSLISLWERGDMEGAVSTYFHLDRPVSRQMTEGKEIHEDIAKTIDETGAFPKYLNFDYQLLIPETEKAVTVPYNELCDLKAIFDCYSIPDLFEFKTGVSDSLVWSRTFQVPLYFLIAELDGIPEDMMEKAYIIRYNQYNKTSDYTVVHNTKEQRDKARNVVDSVVYPIWKYFSDEGLI